LIPARSFIALAAATNAGSAATLIGSPQNIPIGSLGRLDFWSFLAICAVPALFSLVVIFAVVWLQWQARISRTVLAATLDPPQVTLHPLDRNQTINGRSRCWHCSFCSRRRCRARLAR